MTNFAGGSHAIVLSMLFYMGLLKAVKATSETPDKELSVKWVSPKTRSGKSEDRWTSHHSL